ncbi:Lysine-specific demethylase JMJ30-like protein [Drosera capensis]
MATKQTLQTPVLDREATGLLRLVSEQGGYAFVMMVGLGEGGDMGAAEAAREMAWEQIQGGPREDDVAVPVWMEAYSMACLMVAKNWVDRGEAREAMRVVDMGLIMGGGGVLRGEMEMAAKTVAEMVRNEREKGGLVVEEDGRGSELYFNGVNGDEVLPIKSLSSTIVKKKSSLSLEGFLRDYFLSGTPVIISDSMNYWPARTKWRNVDYLKRIAGYRTVPVEIGKTTLSQERNQELITFSEFLNRLLSPDSAAAPTHLSQHPLFDQIKELRNDVFIPDYCRAGGGELRPLNAWFGPAGVVTRLCHDPHHNILAQAVKMIRLPMVFQVVGKKYVRLYPAFLSEELYPHNETILCNSSKVDLDNIDEMAFPKVRDLEFVDCILDEGEMLYMPPNWWHYMRSLTPSFSVGFRWNASDG